MEKNKGITLVALVITVIILLILSGVGISLITGQEGLFDKTRQAAEMYNEASKNEQNSINDLLAELNNITSGSSGSNVGGDTPTPLKKIATDILEESDGTEYYGKYITNYKPEGVTDVKWRIFYIGKDPTNTGENNIYLIADHYVPRGDLPEKNGAKPNDGADDCTRNAYFTNVIGKYTGSSDITSENLSYNWLNKWNNYLSTNNKSSTNENIRAVAYMMDTEIWDKFNVLMNGNKVGKYVIGGPTIELYEKSYNEAHNDKKIDTIVQDSIGYKVKWSNVVDYSNSISQISDDKNLWKPYVQYNTNGIEYTEIEAYGMWVASTACESVNYLFSADAGGHLYDIDYYFSDNLGFRPIVCLKSNVKIEPDGSEYKLADGS